MKIVDLREFESHPGTYIAAAREGEFVVVIDGDKAVVTLNAAPPDIPLDHPFAEMALRGEARLGRPLSPEEKAKLYHRSPGPPVLQGTTSAEILDALREDTRP